MTKYVKLLVPDMPVNEQCIEWFTKIDAQQWYTNFGPLNTEFERQVSTLFNSEETVHLTTVSNATMGLFLMLKALDLKPNATVLIPSYTFPATILAVIHAGLTPILSDVDPLSFLLTPAIAKEAMARYDISAVIPVCIFGQPYEPNIWDEFCKATGAHVLIDAAGAIQNQDIGNHFHVVFSLHATKPLPAGEGGLVVSKNQNLIDKIRCLSNFGFEQGWVVEDGLNAKMSEYHAAVGLASLAKYSDSLTKRKQLLNQYEMEILNMPETCQVESFLISENFYPANFAIQLQIPATKKLQTDLDKKGVETRKWYWPLLHQHASTVSI